MPITQVKIGAMCRASEGSGWLAHDRQRREKLNMKNVEKVFHKFSTLWLKIGG
jgi:hypothetical protein